MTVTGLEGNETTRTLDGSGEGSVRMVTTGPRGTAETTVDFANRTNALVLPVPAPGERAPGFPLSGSVTHSRTMVFKGPEQQARVDQFSETTTFNGTGVVQVTITINGVTRSCTRDMVSRRQSCG
jgi:hypothetical protein